MGIGGENSSANNLGIVISLVWYVSFRIGRISNNSSISYYLSLKVGVHG